MRYCPPKVWNNRPTGTRDANYYHHIAHDSYRINITSINAEHDISMREVYGLDKSLRELTRISGFRQTGQAVSPHKNIHLLFLNIF